MRIVAAIILVLLSTGCGKGSEDQSGNSLRTVLKDAGVEMRTPEAVSDKDAARIIDGLLPTAEWASINPSATPQSARAIVFDYGERGKLLSLQKILDASMGSMITVDIDAVAGIRLRHQIVVGTDLARWKLIRKETTWPNDSPFKRVYLFRRANTSTTDVRGLVFLEGVMVEISYSGPVTDKTIDEVSAITWRTAARLNNIYPDSIKPISEGPLFKTNPILTRPDLPDPDSSGMHEAQR